MNRRHKCFKYRQRGHVIKNCPMKKQNEGIEKNGNRSETEKAKNEVLMASKPSVSIKYPKSIHFETKCMLKGTDQGIRRKRDSNEAKKAKSNGDGEKDSKFKCAARHPVFDENGNLSIKYRLNDKYIKEKKMEAKIQRRIWDLGIKVYFLRQHLEDKMGSKGVGSVTHVVGGGGRTKRVMAAPTWHKDIAIG
ncbi:hypothetical protein Tco_1118808 [Tanacetum coccineum]